MSRHTKPPWRFGRRNPYPNEPLEITIDASHPQTGGIYTVAVALPCGHGDGRRDLMPEMTEANAHLIAAAPDLYEALVAMWKWQARCQELLPDGLGDAVIAAIAKAEGRI